MSSSLGYNPKMTSKWLEKEEDRAWRGYRHMFTLLEAQLARDLAADSDLSMADYTVLSNLAEAPGREFRVTALAERMQWSQSRLSHQISRMEKRGLLARSQAVDDGRGAVVSLTKSGLRAIAAATPIHMRSVRKHIVDLLTPEQLKVLGAISDRVVAHLSEEANDAVPSL